MIGAPDRMLSFLERALDLSQKRQAVLSSNIANTDTPGFVPSDLDFRATLAEQLKNGTDVGATVDPRAELSPSALEPQPDGNQVDLDKEVGRITQNRVFNDMATEVISRRLAMLRYAIDEGGR